LCTARAGTRSRIERIEAVFAPWPDGAIVYGQGRNPLKD
jgi:hypothetical protein